MAPSFKRIWVLVLAPCSAALRPVSHTARAPAQLGFGEQALKMWVEADSHLTEALAADSDPWVLSHKVTLQESVAAVRAQLGLITVTESQMELTL